VFPVNFFSKNDWGELEFAILRIEDLDSTIIFAEGKN